LQKLDITEEYGSYHGRTGKDEGNKKKRNPMLSFILLSSVMWIIVIGSLALALLPPEGNNITFPPSGASRVFSPLPVQWSPDKDVSVEGDGSVDAFMGSHIETAQKVAVNLALQTSSSASVTFYVDNLSEDNQIFVISANALPQVILDMESDDVNITGLIGHNRWLAVVDESASEQSFIMEVSVTDVGFYPIVIELTRVG
jgi:hypothetical protein